MSMLRWPLWFETFEAGTSTDVPGWPPLPESEPPHEALTPTTASTIDTAEMRGRTREAMGGRYDASGGCPKPDVRALRGPPPDRAYRRRCVLARRHRRSRRPMT